MLNTIFQNNKVSFRANNKVDCARNIGVFFESEVKSGSILSFKPQLVDSLSKRQSSGQKVNPYVMSLSGYTGSGKTFFSNLASQTLGQDSFKVITGDNAYKDLSPVFQKYGGFPGLIAAHYDLQGPHNFDLEASAKKIIDLRNGVDVVYFNKYLMDDTGRIVPNGAPVEKKPFMLFEGVCSVFSPLKESFDSRALLKVSPAESERRFFERNRSYHDKHLYVDAIAGGKKYIDPEEPNMDLVISGEAHIDKMKNFVKGFFDIVTK